MTTNDNADPRLQKLERWIAGLPGPPVDRIAPASADASFRRYFRVHRGGATQIAMDAPPERESLDAWLRVARILAATGVHVPPVLAVDAEQGFVLMGDLGRQHYLEAHRPGRGSGAALRWMPSMRSCACSRAIPPRRRSCRPTTASC